MENEFLMSLLPTWHSLSPAMDIQAPEVSCPAAAAADQSTDCFFNPYWDKSIDSNCGLALDSALSSMASSPVSPANPANDSFLIRELIGKLGGFPPQGFNSIHPKENALKLGHYALPPNPGFAGHSPAARFSSIGSQSFNGRPSQLAELAAMGQMMSRVSSSPSLGPLGSPAGDPQGNKKPNPTLQDQAELSNSQEESSVSDPEKNRGLEMGSKAPGQANCRKRKAAAAPRGKEAEPEIEGDSDAKRPKQSNGGTGNENGSVKTEEEAEGGNDGNNANGKDENLQVKNEAKPPEPPKDYIHVRARRGQATDSHSLAERVRREKISERMKILQDLVPGCNKVTGKALMLDEIINYVQSLQHQVEFLSMKLASVNTGTDMNTANAMVKDVFHPDSTIPQQMLQLDSSPSALYGQKNPAVHLPNGTTPQYSADLLDGPFLPYSAFRGDDLHSIVQMGFGQN